MSHYCKCNNLLFIVRRRRRGKCFTTVRVINVQLYHSAPGVFCDYFFHQESTLLSNPPSLLRGQTKNRWEDLFKNPLENSIEPFERLGQNTYLSLINNDEDCKDEVKEEVKE